MDMDKSELWWFLTWATKNAHCANSAADPIQRVFSNPVIYMHIHLLQTVHISYRFLALNSTHLISEVPNLTTIFVLMLIIIILSFINSGDMIEVCSVHVRKSISHMHTFTANDTHFISLWLSILHISLKLQIWLVPLFLMQIVIILSFVNSGDMVEVCSVHVRKSISHICTPMQKTWWTCTCGREQCTSSEKFRKVSWKCFPLRNSTYKIVRATNYTSLRKYMNNNRTYSRRLNYGPGLESQKIQPLSHTESYMEIDTHTYYHYRSLYTHFSQTSQTLTSYREYSWSFTMGIPSRTKGSLEVTTSIWTDAITGWWTKKHCSTFPK